MTCGPAQQIQDLINNINRAVDFADDAIASLPKKVASIPGYAELQLASQIYKDVQLFKELLDDPEALADYAVKSLPLEIQEFILAGNNLIGSAADTVEFIRALDEKYGGSIDDDPEELLRLINDLGADINTLCQIVPNIQSRYGELVEKAQPLSGVFSRPPNAPKKKKIPISKKIGDFISNYRDDFQEDIDNIKSFDDLERIASEPYLLAK